MDEPLSTGERFLAIRDMKATTLAKILPELRRSESPESVELRIDTLRSVLEAISSLHAIEAVHGDVKPDNIAVSIRSRHALLMDFGSYIPLGKLHEAEIPYRSPGTGGSYTADVYSFGALMAEVIANLRLDTMAASTNLTARQLTWLSEAARWGSAHDRPDAHALYAVLFDRTNFANVVSQSVTDAGHELLRMLNRENRPLYSFDQLKLATSNAASRSIERFIKHPETMVYADKGVRLVSLLASVPFDFPGDVAHNRANDNQLRMESEYIREFPTNIDSDLKSRIEFDALEKYGSLDDDHARAELSDTITFYDAFRRQLLQESNYLDEDSVVRLLSRGSKLPVSEGQIATRRQWGELVAVRDGGRWLFPEFQFDVATLEPFPIIGEVAKRFIPDESEWAILYWWLTPLNGLQGKSPAQALRNDELRSRILDILPPPIS